MTVPKELETQRLEEKKSTENLGEQETILGVWKRHLERSEKHRNHIYRKEELETILEEEGKTEKLSLKKKEKQKNLLGTFEKQRTWIIREKSVFYSSLNYMLKGAFFSIFDIDFNLLNL